MSTPKSEGREHSGRSLHAGLEVEAVVGEEDRMGRIDALLNIAGPIPQIDLFEMSDEQWKAGMELKLHDARRLTIREWDALKRSQGSVVFMSGSAALASLGYDGSAASWRRWLGKGVGPLLVVAKKAPV